MLRPTWLSPTSCLSSLASLLLASSTYASGPASAFTPLVKLPVAKILACAEEYPATNFVVAHLVDDAELSEYASNGKGTETFVVFDFGQSVTIAGFKHVDRKDPATVDEAELVFSDQSDFSQVIARETIDHANAPGAMTVALFAAPHTAQFVRWQATRLGPEGHACVGGSAMCFFTPEAVEPTLQRDQVELLMVQAVQRSENGPVRPLTVKVQHAYAEPVEATLKVGDLAAVPLRLEFGSQSATVLLPAGEQETQQQADGIRRTGGRRSDDSQPASERRSGSSLGTLLPAPFACRYRLHACADRGGAEAVGLSAAGDANRPQYGRLSDRVPLQMELGSAVGSGQLSAAGQR